MNPDPQHRFLKIQIGTLKKGAGVSVSAFAVLIKALFEVQTHYTEGSNQVLSLT
jgi:hypothetical protein